MNLDNSLLSHQVKIAQKLAANYQECFVLTSDTVHDKFQNTTIKIRSLSWDKGNKFSKFLRLYLSVFHLLIQFKPTHVFYHMVDTHCALVSPVFFLARKRQILWYAHQKKSLPLRISSMFVDTILTSTDMSFPKSPKRIQRKLKVIGQGVDTEDFPHLWKNSKKFRRVISVGRLDPSKGMGLILEALGKCKIGSNPFCVSFAGISSSRASAVAFETILKKSKNDCPDLEVILLGSLKREQLARTIAEYDFFIHAYQGSLDKVLVEATMVGIPVVTINAEYLRLFGSWSLVPQPSLEQELDAFLQSDFSIIEQIGKDRLEICLKDHSLVGWVDRVTREISRL